MNRQLHVYRDAYDAWLYQWIAFHNRAWPNPHAVPPRRCLADMDFGEFEVRLAALKEPIPFELPPLRGLYYRLDGGFTQRTSTVYDRYQIQPTPTRGINMAKPPTVTLYIGTATAKGTDRAALAPLFAAIRDRLAPMVPAADVQVVEDDEDLSHDTILFDGDWYNTDPRSKDELRELIKRERDFVINAGEWLSEGGE